MTWLERHLLNDMNCPCVCHRCWRLSVDLLDENTRDETCWRHPTGRCFLCGRTYSGLSGPPEKARRGVNIFCPLEGVFDFSKLYTTNKDVSTDPIFGHIWARLHIYELSRGGTSMQRQRELWLCICYLTSSVNGTPLHQNDRRGCTRVFSIKVHPELLAVTYGWTMPFVLGVYGRTWRARLSINYFHAFESTRVG